MKFAVKINSSSKHIVHANNPLAAIKKTLESLVDDGDAIGSALNLEISVRAFGPKEAPVTKGTHDDKGDAE